MNKSLARLISAVRTRLGEVMIAFDIVVTAMQNGRLVSDKLTLIYNPCLDATEQLGAESGPVVLPQGQARA